MDSLLDLLSILVPLLVCLVNIRSRKHVLWYYVLFGSIIECSILTSKILFGENNGLNILANIFILIELITIGCFYSIKFNNVWKKTILILTATASLIFVYDCIKSQLAEINTIALSCLSLLYLLVSTIGYLRMFRNMSHKYIESSSFFWFNTAFFIYASSSLLIFLFADYLMKENQQLFYYLWQYIYKIVNIARYALIGIGLGRLKRQ